MATAHLLMYSGAKNPSRALSKEESRHVLAAVAASLKDGAVVKEPPPRLGGAAVEWTSADTAALYKAVVARDGVITVYWVDAKRPKETRTDAGGVEAHVRFLLRDIMATRAASSVVSR